MNICGNNKNAIIAHQKFWVMGGTKVHMGGDTEFLGWGGGQPSMGGSGHYGNPCYTVNVYVI